MCRLSAIISDSYFSPMENIMALETMKEGHDGSGLGLVLRDLGGEFLGLKEYPILSGICSKEGLRVMDEYMVKLGFKTKHLWNPRIKNYKGKMKARGFYFARAYEYPEWAEESSEEVQHELLTKTRLELRDMGKGDDSIIIFSFWPDLITMKEVGDPLDVGLFFGLDKKPLLAKNIFAQGRQNTNYAINLYACHPFFIEGFTTMTNGENTAFVPIREFLTSRGFPGYVGYRSDSEVFCHILHYIRKELKFPLKYYKDVITPLFDREMDERSDKAAIELIKRVLRPLTIDGPNCTIGTDTDGTVFMAHDSKKLRPGVIGGVPGKYALMSEVCGVDTAVPERDHSKDVFPMKYDMAMISKDAKEIKIWNQKHGSMSTV
ncbi:MAG: glutamate synthase, partial [Deltaproteobacteria bacterium]|nr:glutamate synthase [Deltaproteobacteria bacterium]